MTLHRQLVLSIITTFSLLLAGLLIMDLSQSHDLIEQKQFSEVKNALNTTGLALSPYLIQNDVIAVETVVNALFDGSSFSTVKVNILSSGDEIIRTYPIKDNSVPQWLLNSEIFSPIHETRVITSGWLQLAELEIISHPGSAYQSLWESIKFTLLISLIALVIALIALTVLVKRALIPLTHLSKAAAKISDHDFAIHLPKPKTKDLIPVFIAFNTMVDKLKRHFEEQIKKTDELTKQAFVDPVTQLPNRKYYIAQLDMHLDSGRPCTVGIIKYSEAAYHVEHAQFEELKQLMHSIAEDVQSLQSDKIMFARISDDELAFIANYSETNKAQKLQSQLVAARSDTFVNKNFDCGILITETNATASDVLSALDCALTLAKSQSSRIYLQKGQGQAQYSKSQWLQIVKGCIQNQAVMIKYQSVERLTSGFYHKELFSSISVDGEQVTAFRFLNALEQIKQSAFYDCYIIETVLEELETTSATTPVAVNLSQGTIIEPEFLTWLDLMLTRHSGITSLIHFELPESVFVFHPHMTQLLVKIFQKHSTFFGVDNFGHHLNSLEYLQSFTPNYVKLDYSFTRNLESGTIDETLSTIINLAKDIDTFVIATRVENSEEIQTLTHYDIDGLQGFAIDAKDSN